MSRRILVGLFGLMAILLVAPMTVGQEQGPAEPAYLNIKVPATAKLEIQGRLTQQTGELRRFVSPPLTGGKKYTYTVKASWKGADGKEIIRSEDVQVFPGKPIDIDLLTAKKEDKTNAPAAATKPAEAVKTESGKTVDVVKGSGSPKAADTVKTAPPAAGAGLPPLTGTDTKAAAPNKTGAVAPAVIKPDTAAPAATTKPAETTKPPETTAADDKDRRPDVIYVPTPHEVVAKMLELADVKKDDVLFDLGCGDARIPITASRKFGCKTMGFDIDPDRIKDSNENLKKEKKEVQDLVKIEKKDIFTLDLSKANVITLYLLPDLNVKLIPQLEKLKPGSRIVSHDFDMRGVKPDKVVEVEGPSRKHTIYLWTVPLKKEKE